MLIAATKAEPVPAVGNVAAEENKMTGSRTQMVDREGLIELNVGEVIELKNNAIREFIRLILSTGMFGDKGGNFTDEFIQASQSEFLDNFMRKFIGVN